MVDLHASLFLWSFTWLLHLSKYCECRTFSFLSLTGAIFGLLLVHISQQSQDSAHWTRTGRVCLCCASTFYHSGHQSPSNEVTEYCKLFKTEIRKRKQSHVLTASRSSKISLSTSKRPPYTGWWWKRLINSFLSCFSYKLFKCDCPLYLSFRCNLLCSSAQLTLQHDQSFTDPFITMIKQLFMNHLDNLQHDYALCESWKQDFFFFHHAKWTQNLPVKPPEWELDSVKGAIFECCWKATGRL